MLPKAIRLEVWRLTKFHMLHQRGRPLSTSQPVSPGRANPERHSRARTTTRNKNATPSAGARPCELGGYAFCVGGSFAAIILRTLPCHPKPFQNCVAFDYTTNSKHDSCRLYDAAAHASVPLVLRRWPKSASLKRIYLERSKVSFWEHIFRARAKKYVRKRQLKASKFAGNSKSAKLVNQGFNPVSVTIVVLAPPLPN